VRWTQDVLLGTWNDSLVSFSKPNIIRFGPGYGGAITVHLADQFEVVLVDNLGPGNGGATPFLVQQ